MTGIQSLPLEDAFEDSPRTRSLLGVFEKDANLLRTYSTTFQHCCLRVLNAQREMCSATQSLSSHMKSYAKHNFPLEGPDSILAETLQQFTNYLDELSSIHQILSTQMADSMMYPLNKFIQADLEEIGTMGEMYKLSSSDHEQSVHRYMKLPKKKLTESARQEANEDLFVYRKKCHQTALHYFAALNSLQYKRKTALLEPMIAYMQAQKGFFAMGHEATDKPDIDSFLGNISASVQTVHQELAQETQKTVEMVDSIERSSTHLYHAEPHSDLPYTPPNTDLAQKGGYLFIRSKQMLTTKWDRAYFFIQGGNLMMQAKDEVAGSLVLDLNEDKVKAETSDADDRRYLFQIVSPSRKKTVILQAENDRERLEWISTINNCVNDAGYVIGTRPQSVNSQKERSGSSASSQGMAIPKREGLPGAPPTPTSTPVDGGFIPDAPIQFDIITPNNSQLQQGGPKDGPQTRINPFDQSPEAMLNSKKGEENAAFSQTFIVRFCGSMEVRHDRGEQLILEIIRQIMAARAIHNVFKMTESHLVVTSENMRLLDPSNHTVRVEYQLQDISYWAFHKENSRLFGFINRQKTEDENRARFLCHVFECNSSGDEICHAISTATKLAFQALMEKKTNATQPASESATFTEKDILLANIEELDDEPDPSAPRISADGQYLILGGEHTDEEGDEDHHEEQQVATPVKPVGDGDAREVEGAESEA